MRRTSLRGHALRSEGKPYKLSDENEWAPQPHGQHHDPLRGHALCECGATSEWLYSDAARKRWHAQHKEQERAAINGERTP